MKLSAAIITLNAAQELDRCLASLSFADEIVVVDQNSEDNTVEICQKHGAKLHQSQWLGFGPTKDLAVSLCQNKWVLSIDSDEEVSPQLRDALQALPDNPSEAAFTVNRMSRFLGSWIRHCGWHPDHVTRVFDRDRASFNDKPVHESVETNGRLGSLPGLLYHYTYETMEQYIEKLNRYTTLAAEERFAAGVRASLAKAVTRSLAAFWRMWILQGGILDRWPGYVLCLASSFYVLSKYTKLWILGNQDQGGQG